MSFNFEKFGDEIEKELKGNCVGYAFVVSYEDNWRVKRAGGMARTIYNVPPLEMATNVRFHLASVSKAITAVALLKILNERKDVSLDTAFHSFLPDHWHVHESLRQITFRQLLTHTSGFRFNRGLQYHNLKNDMAIGVDSSNVNVYNYQGENYAIMRILIPRLANYRISENGGPAMDILQAAEHVKFYMDYVQKELFDKAGLQQISCEAEPLTAGTCYHFPYNNKPGEDFGNQTLVVGSKGWVMSAAELSKLFRVVHHTEKILPASLSKRMKDELLGYDAKGSTNEGIDVCWKNGGFPGSENAGELNTLIIVYENRVQVALIINSELDNPKGPVQIINDAHDAAYDLKKVNAGNMKRK